MRIYLLVMLLIMPSLAFAIEKITTADIEGFLKSQSVYANSKDAEGEASLLSQDFTYKDKDGKIQTKDEYRLLIYNAMMTTIAIRDSNKILSQDISYDGKTAQTDVEAETKYLFEFAGEKKVVTKRGRQVLHFIIENGQLRAKSLVETASQ